MREINLQHRENKLYAALFDCKHFSHAINFHFSCCSQLRTTQAESNHNAD